jgi:predicted alpha/beta hydrolase family esterase
MHVLFDYASEIVRLHNEAVSLQSDIISRQDDLNTLMIYPVASSDDEFITNISMLADRTNSLTHLINNNNGKYSLLLEEMKDINSSINAAQESFIKHVKGLSAAYVDMYVAESLACLEDNCSMLSNYSLLLAKSGQVSLDGSAEFISAVCSHYDALNFLLTARKAVAQSRRLLINDTSATDTEQDRAILMLLLEINSSLYDGLEDNLDERLFLSSPASIHIGEYITFLNISTGKINKGDILYADNYSLNNIFMDKNLQNLNTICSRHVSSVTLDAFLIKPIIVDNITVPVSEYYLSSKESSCCYYGVCIGCCANCKKKNPLILLHGHSFNVKTSAYTSTESFNQLEKNLTQDMFYMSLGTPENNLYNRGDVGLSPEPVLIKATYYLTSYSDNLGQISVETKTGNIDTYAIRLKEIIDYVKYITGSENVDIVAHSMGGLVVRRYLQVFGDKSVEKLVMLGTPNNGIDEKTHSYCKIFGELNECNDMYYDSVFMKKLNDQSNLPQMPKTLIIIGAGCDTGGKDGDGVVSVESAGLYNISSIIINGSCSGTSLMHSKLLDIELYPRVYESIVDFLK